MALTAIFYFLIKNPDTYQKLRTEIEQTDQAGSLSESVEFQEGLSLRYLSVSLH
jgi:hypothetical protein